MDNETEPEKMQSRPSSEAAEVDTSNPSPLTFSDETANTDFASVQSSRASKRHSKQPLSDWREMHRIERYRTTIAIKKFMRSDKAPMVDPKDRFDKLYGVREEAISASERDGKGSMRTSFPSHLNEGEVRSELQKKHASYIFGREPSGQAQDQGFRRDSASAREENMDDPEPDLINSECRIKQEFKDDDELHPSADSTNISNAGLVAGMAIARGFCDARLADSQATKVNVARTWKFIGGRWVPIPMPSVNTSSAFAKQPSEKLDREIEHKKAKVE